MGVSACDYHFSAYCPNRSAIGIVGPPKNGVNRTITISGAVRPQVPAENKVKVALRAGEKLFTILG
jgi:hypothetical protein